MTTSIPLAEVEVKGMLATRVLAYASLEHDMATCREGIAFLRSLPPPTTKDFAHMVVWMGIVTSYARAFTDGRRAAYAKPLIPTTAPFDKTHEWVVEHRHGYVAHLGSSEVWESGRVLMAVSAPGSSTNAVQTVSHEGERWLVPNNPTLTDFEALVIEMERRMAGEYQSAVNDVVDAAEARGHVGLYKSATAGRHIRLTKPTATPGSASARYRGRVPK